MEAINKESHWKWNGAIICVAFMIEIIAVIIFVPSMFFLIYDHQLK